MAVTLLDKMVIDSSLRRLWTVAYARSILGHCLSMQGRYAEAESLMTRSMSIIEETGALSDRKKQEAIRHLTRLYEAWGKPEEAAFYRARLVRFGKPPG